MSRRAASIVFLILVQGCSREPGATKAPSSTTPAPTATAMPTSTATAMPTSTATTTKPPCNEGMLLVEGERCPDAIHTCLRWMDPPPYDNLRCAEYKQPAICKGARQPMRYCIDREEFTETAPGEDPKNAVPVVRKNWKEAQALCATRGAHICEEVEWEFACEGPDMSPYPYGWKRDSTACNIDRTDLGGAEEKLTDHRAPQSAFARCVSPFGVHNMVGNVDEWTTRPTAVSPNRSILRGGWWLPGRNRCRAFTLGHGEGYTSKQVGFRCCKSVSPPDASP